MKIERVSGVVCIKFRRWNKLGLSHQDSRKLPEAKVVSLLKASKIGCHLRLIGGLVFFSKFILLVESK